MKRPVNVTFLTEAENKCMELLIQAQDIFDKLCDEEPQNSVDSYNFGHFMDSARMTVLVRGARRMDAENLLVKHSNTSTMNRQFDALMRKVMDGPDIKELEVPLYNSTTSSEGTTDGGTQGT